MFANFTEETCTGTAATLTLTGVTTDASGNDNLPFSASFADGDTASIALNDSAGVIKIAGIYTYNDPANTFTRNDTWNWNGTVVDDSPATNIALSGGTHVIRCDVTAKEGKGRHKPLAAGKLLLSDSSQGTNASSTVDADKLYVASFVLAHGASVNAILAVVTTAIAASKARMCIYSLNLDGTVKDIIAESGDVDTATTGVKEAAITEAYLPADEYGLGFICDSAVAIYANTSYRNHPSSVFGASVEAWEMGWNGYGEVAIAAGWTAMPTSPTLGLSVNNRKPFLALRVA